MTRLLLFFLIAPLFLFSQPQSTYDNILTEAINPESVNISSRRLSHIDKICQEAVDQRDVPGIVALITRRGKIIYEKAFGVSNIETGKKMETNDIFRIASQTKAITSTAVMMLWEEGHFRLDDPISKWIPEFKNTGVLDNFRYSDTTFTTKPVKREITIRHLLTHTAGIGYGAIDGDERIRMLYAKAGIKEIASSSPLTTAENIRKLAVMPLHFHPGEKYSYSMGLDVLGYFIEIISGMRFDEFLRTRLFEPLGMKDTYFYLPAEKNARLIPIHVPGENGWVVSDVVGDSDPDFPITGSRTLHSGGGGLSSTARDYAQFLQMYLNGGVINGERILSRKTVDIIMANHIKDFWGNGGSHYGLAFGVVDQNGEHRGGSGSAGTFSWGGAFNTQYFADPENELIGIIMKQTLYQRSDKTGWKFRQLVGQSITSEGSGKTLIPASPQDAGMSTDHLNRIDDICKEAIANRDIPGAVALIVRDGKVVYHKAFGHSDNAHEKNMDKEDIFRIASQTKAITATATMMLWEEGHFKLDDPISRWIPEFANPKILKDFRYSDTTYTTEPAKSEITIRHLLTHTSGIGYGIIDPHEGMRILYKRSGIQEIAAQDGLTTEQNIKNLAALPLHFEPGEKYQYAMGLDVLGYLVEIISGQPYDQFLRERIFDPLDMEDTYFHLPAEKADRLVTVQRKEKGEWIEQPVTSYDPGFPLTGQRKFCAGGGGLVSTAMDYAKFLQMYLNDGVYNGVQILSPTTIDAVMGNQIGDFWGDNGKYYGLAFGVVNGKGEDMGGEGSEGTFDWGGYFNTSYFADPKEKVIGILMKQTMDASSDQTGWKFRQIVSQAIAD